MDKRPRQISRREFAKYSASVLAVPPVMLTWPGAVVASEGHKIASSSGFCSPAGWDRAYEARWGLLGTQSRAQIEKVIHAANGIYDDSSGVFSWIVHYWLRAWVRMADWTGDTKYLDTGVSFI